jgi:hypothetical protein
MLKQKLIKKVIIPLVLTKPSRMAQHLRLLKSSTISANLC